MGHAEAVSDSGACHSSWHESALGEEREARCRGHEDISVEWKFTITYAREKAIAWFMMGPRRVKMARRRWTEYELNLVYDSTKGYCRYCGKKLSFQNYGMQGEKGAWHIEHKVPLSRGGTDYLRNLAPACIDCNIEKSDRARSTFEAKFEPATFGGKIVKFLGFPEGSFGTSRRRRRTR